jgi:hypothetical protein
MRETQVDRADCCRLPHRAVRSYPNTVITNNVFRSARHTSQGYPQRERRIVRSQSEIQYSSSPPVKGNRTPRVGTVIDVLVVHHFHTGTEQRDAPRIYQSARAKRWSVGGEDRTGETLSIVSRTKGSGRKDPVRSLQNDLTTRPVVASRRALVAPLRRERLGTPASQQLVMHTPPCHCHVRDASMELYGHTRRSFSRGNHSWTSLFLGEGFVRRSGPHRLITASMLACHLVIQPFDRGRSEFDSPTGSISFARHEDGVCFCRPTTAMVHLLSCPVVSSLGPAFSL